MVIFQDNKVYFRRLKYVLMDQIKDARRDMTNPEAIDSLVFVTHDNVSHTMRPILLDHIRQIQHNVHIASRLLTESFNYEHLEESLSSHLALPFAKEVERDNSIQKDDYSENSNELKPQKMSGNIVHLPFQYKLILPSPHERRLHTKEEMEMESALQKPSGQPKDLDMEIDVHGVANDTQKTICELQSIDQEIQQLHIQRETVTHLDDIWLHTIH